MIFLIDYDRSKGKLLKLVEFPDAHRLQAQYERLQTELNLSKQGLLREVVLLEANNLDALKRTHQRYFRTAEELAKECNAVDRNPS